MKNITPIKVIPWDGKKISVPGIYSGVPIDFYHGDCCVGPSFSSTTLRKVEDPELSMEEIYDELYLNPDAKEPETKEVFIRGRAVHTLLLGEGGFKEQFKIRPETYNDEKTGAEKPWNGNAGPCKKWLAEAALAGVSVLKPDVVPNIRGMADKLAAHPVVQAGILNGLIEHSIFWQDPITGLWLKARPDAIPLDSNMGADLKGAESVSRSSTRKSISNFGYHQQLALVADGMYQTTGRVLTDFTLVFVKWTRPWSINHKPVSAQAIYRGRQQNRRAIDRLAVAVRDNSWPGHDDDEATAELQDWLEGRLAREEEQGLLPAIFADISQEPRGYTPPATEDDDEAV